MPLPNEEQGKGGPGRPRKKPSEAAVGKAMTDWASYAGKVVDATWTLRRDAERALGTKHADLSLILSGKGLPDMEWLRILHSALEAAGYFVEAEERETSYTLYMAALREIAEAEQRGEPRRVRAIGWKHKRASAQYELEQTLERARRERDEAEQLRSATEQAAERQREEPKPENNLDDGRAQESVRWARPRPLAVIADFTGVVVGLTGELVRLLMTLPFAFRRQVVFTQVLKGIDTEYRFTTYPVAQWMDLVDLAFLLLGNVAIALAVSSIVHSFQLHPVPAWWQTGLFGICVVILHAVTAWVLRRIHAAVLPVHTGSGGITASIGTLLSIGPYAVLAIGTYRPQWLGPISTWGQAIAQITLQ